MNRFTVHVFPAPVGPENWRVTFTVDAQLINGIARRKYRAARRRGLSAYDARDIVIGQLAAIVGCEPQL